jgi:hypothetical protein
MWFTFIQFLDALNGRLFTSLRLRVYYEDLCAQRAAR